MSAFVFTVLLDRFPSDGPLELTSVRAASVAEATTEAARLVPGLPVFVRSTGRARSPSSTAYRAWCAEKRAARRQITEDHHV